MANKGVTIRNVVDDCEVEDEIENTGKIEVQTDGKTNFFIGDEVTKTKAKSITHKPKIGQTIATATSSRSVEGESGNTAEVIIGNRIELCEVKENVTNKSEISYQTDDKNKVIIGDAHKKNKVKKLEFGQTIKQGSIISQSECNEGPRCAVCMIEPVNTRLEPCGHAQLCDKCIDRIDTIDKNCPICRTPFTDRQTIFLWEATVNVSETTVVQGDVSSSIPNEQQQETESPSFGIRNWNPQPDKSVAYAGIGPVTVAEKAGIVNSSLNKEITLEEAMKMQNANKIQASDKHMVTVNNIGPMNQIKKYEAMNNALNVKMISK